MKKIIKKIIQINTSSVSLMVKEIKPHIFTNWYGQIGILIKKNYPALNVECWSPERKFKKEKTYMNQGVKFRLFPTNLSIRHGMEISRAIIRALKEEEARLKNNEKIIVHLHEYHSWISYSILKYADKNKTRIICQHHGGRSPFANLRAYKRLFLVFPIIWLMNIFERKFFRKVDIFYGLSDKENKYLIKVAPDSDVKFQTMGIDEDYFKYIDKKEAREKLKLNQDKKYVLYMGRIKTTKGIKELLDAIKSIEAELILLGVGVNSDKYKKYAQEQKIKNVNFLGEIFGDKKRLYLSACDCLILPSYTEGAPVVLMEAIAKNLPVVATNVGGIPKMIKNGREGIIIEPKSSEQIQKALHKILNWPHKDIRKYAEKYKWGEIIQDTMEDYRRII
jgi:glycosyltransferase involved in cell wall biosynthesis